MKTCKGVPLFEDECYDRISSKFHRVYIKKYTIEETLEDCIDHQEKDLKVLVTKYENMSCVFYRNS